MTAVCNRRMRSSCYCSDFVIETVTRQFQKIQSFAKRCRPMVGSTGVLQDPSALLAPV